MTTIHHKWTDIIASIAIDRWLDAIEEKRRLVDTGLFTSAEHKELCAFTKFFSCDYKKRFLWSKLHNLIEYRGRSTWSHWWYGETDVDHIITVYGPKDINVKGFKNKKHVLELHYDNLETWDDYKRVVLEPYHLMEKNPEFLGRRDTHEGINWIGDGTGFIGPVSKWILEDSPIEK